MAKPQKGLSTRRFRRSPAAQYDAGGHCTLRAAIQETNALAGPNTIDLPTGTYIFQIGGIGEDAATTGDLDTTDDLTLNGAGATDTLIDANRLDRVFQIVEAVTVEISGVTAKNGLAVGSVDNFEEGSGGGFFNRGTLKLTDCAVSVNNARFSGGGIDNRGAMELTNCTISGNKTSGEGGGGISAGRTTRLTNCSNFRFLSSRTEAAVHRTETDQTRRCNEAHSGIFLHV